MEKHIVRVPCGEDGLEDHWIDFDASKWKTAFYYRQIGNSTRNESIPDWIEPFSVDWHMAGVNGESIKHPGPMPDFDAMPEDNQAAARLGWANAWLAIWEQIPLEIVDWLTSTQWLALSEVMAANRKRVSKRKKRSTKKRKS